MLKLNRDKTELLVIGPKHKVNPPIKGIHVAGEYIEVSNNARNWFPCQLGETCYEHLQNGLLSFTKYRVFSLTWPAYMQIYWNKRKSLHKKRVQLPEDWFGTPTWPPFHCFGTPIWPPWRHVKTLYRVWTMPFWAGSSAQSSSRVPSLNIPLFIELNN